MRSPVLYMIETIALSALGVIGAQGGLMRGLGPAACVAMGTTICTGGVMRDVICRRDIAFGSQLFCLSAPFVFLALAPIYFRGPPRPKTFFSDSL